MVVVAIGIAGGDCAKAYKSAAMIESDDKLDVGRSDAFDSEPVLVFTVRMPGTLNWTLSSIIRRAIC